MLNMGYPFKSLSKEGRRRRDNGVTIWVTDFVVFEDGRDMGMFVC